ncbi:PadR family transcriptional regulator [Phycicoccus sp. M110.8]|uniref:PadR family transcriptional regulator n=1 Tax=Phycicoccus sp. M110.8 TaxID=3075433 RepID=UPI0028FD2309|nr:PadR family transcriptional regulator [Phycicoccus sp. M110.8]MDU0315091.1 PadR family transcriptional regulator [Phycicoccus sp. M110.8]HET8769231.1 PadR family transcriptional regulator [Pedococcus sp.]
MSPVFAHGQLRLYLLALLDDGPRHGYEVIQDLEQRFNGLYSPSAGTVYPRLAKLEEEGLVERSDEGRKAVYRITDAGRAEVRARQDDLAHLQVDLDDSVRQLAQEVRSRVRGETSDLRAELRAAAREARRTATPAGGGDAWSSWTTSDAQAFGDLEKAVQQLRRDAREAWKRHGVTAEQSREIVAILGEASERIRAVLVRR